jgi:hypothetical protein
MHSCTLTDWTVSKTSPMRITNVQSSIDDEAIALSIRHIRVWTCALLCLPVVKVLNDKHLWHWWTVVIMRCGGRCWGMWGSENLGLIVFIYCIDWYTKIYNYEYDVGMPLLVLVWGYTTMPHQHIFVKFSSQIHTSARTHAHTHTRILKHTYTHTHTDKHTHTGKHTHTHSHTHRVKLQYSNLTPSSQSLCVIP